MQIQFLNPAHRKRAKRYGQLYDTKRFTDKRTTDLTLKDFFDFNTRTIRLKTFTN
jgi:hypothetical protein